MGKRSDVWDVLKGVAILLMVAGHAIQFGSGSAFSSIDGYYENKFFQFIYSFHMPMFMIISGYLFGVTVSRRTVKEIIRSRLETFLLPIFTFSIFSFAIQICRGRIVVAELHGATDILGEFKEIFLYNLWYLWAVFYLSLLVLMVKRFWRDNCWIYGVIFVALFFVPDIFNMAVYKYMYPFFVFGYFVQKDSLRERFTKSNQKIMAIFILIFAGLFLFYDKEVFIYISGHCILKENMWKQLCIDIYRTVIGFAGSLAVIILILELAPKMEGKRVNKYMVLIGRNSLGIYAFSGYIFNFVLPVITKDLPGVNYAVVMLETIVITIICIVITALFRKKHITNLLLFGGR